MVQGRQARAIMQSIIKTYILYRLNLLYRKERIYWKSDQEAQSYASVGQLEYKAKRSTGAFQDITTVEETASRTLFCKPLSKKLYAYIPEMAWG